MIKHLVVLCLISVSLCAGINPEVAQLLDDHLSNYSRTVTIFEICGRNCDLYSTTLARKYASNLVAFVILVEGLSKAAQEIKKENIPNIIIAKPPKILPRTLQLLSTCEDADVVIVHDVPKLLRKLYVWDYLDCYLKMGDYVCIDIPMEDMAVFEKYKNHQGLQKVIAHTRNGGITAFFRTGKKGLEVARWDVAAYGKKPKIKYKIYSDFQEKYLYKSILKTKSTWLAGINLETFVMMHGIYPDDAIIQQSLLNIKDRVSGHNDFVLGNLIITGNHAHALIAIDFDDKRRSANFKKHFNALVKVFGGQRKEFKHPHDFIVYWKEQLGHKR